ncbi:MULTISPECIES: type II toxin-antitoxin system VapC family toxin [unclassified Imperialibacter]|uniref:type II toxin-antitoxin system VapC family toxin n=1 Tax=unclassified Imperialibacter TaxID=2629706 RepID=UPI001254D1EA|nr:MULTISPECIES: type II toxin-antitoxin system VapC family toxin [unclassified Imperialibacter]CAD5249376.1 tRNA(fMet)-specific endonuclease VapC [Imperialibacter sp. 89]CAD5264435.1 tRNA(fMet)-specific endonuclease VapC [Imperialibacter sp. 75]VVT06875.1 tRNA(fMet)-specific endonuclease VapC [Imperialibacter sp. EC-SDR9]
MNRSLIDTDILSYFLKGHKQVTENVKLYLKEQSKITISEITYFEVLSGLTFKKATKQIQEFENFISTCEVLKLSTSSLRISANIYSELREKGITIGTADLLISGIALANNLTLVTNNQKHYQPIEQLSTTNWNE